MIKGSRKEVENEIEQSIASQHFQSGVYQTERDLTGRMDGDNPPYLLYLGYGRVEEPMFIFGICNLDGDKGSVIMTAVFKPKSFLTGFIRMVQNLFPQQNEAFQRKVVSHYCTSFRRMILNECESEDQASLIDDSQLKVFEDKQWIEEKLSTKR